MHPINGWELNRSWFVMRREFEELNSSIGVKYSHPHSYHKPYCSVQMLCLGLMFLPSHGSVIMCSFRVLQ